MQQHGHNTRLTPEKPQRGGHREGAGRKSDKENLHPNKLSALSAGREHRREQQTKTADYKEQQDELANPKGRSWTYHECSLLLTLVIGIIIHYGETPTEALRFVSTLLRRSYDSIHALWSKWQDERLVYVVDTGSRGGGAPSHVYHEHHVTVDVVFTIMEYIRHSNRTGGCCTSSEVQRCILEEHRLHITARTLRSIMSAMGYRYGRGNIIGKMNDEWYIARIRTFLLQYHMAVLKQLKGECVIVYTDESYVNLKHARKCTWYNPDTPEENKVVRPSGKGKRLVLLHAFTEDGWLTLDPSLHNDRVDQRARSCELVYEAEKGGGDYHDNMNGSIYVQWLTERLLPVFAERYPGQKMVLVLDNASYHHARGTDWVNVHRMNKAAIAGKLIELGVRSISGQRQKKGTQTMENFHFEADTFARRGGRYAPTLAELKVELQAYLTAHPQHNRTEVSKLMTQHKHELIYTPPYLPGVQPIERLWAYVKNHVAAEYRAGRTMRELIRQTHEGFYGDGDKHVGVDARLCASVIEHSHTFCNYLIEQDDALSGTIDDLTSESRVVETDVEADIDAEMDPFPGAEEEDDEEA
jgi:hypothetical protein